MYRIPGWIYEPLPYIYLLVGGIASVGFDPLVGKVSGLLLITSAVLIIIMRRDNRACLECNSKTFSQRQ